MDDFTVLKSDRDPYRFGSSPIQIGAVRWAAERVDAARPNLTAIDDNVAPAVRPLEISSRSAKDKSRPSPLQPARSHQEADGDTVDGQTAQRAASRRVAQTCPGF
jgi:hypothetical protein